MLGSKGPFIAHQRRGITGMGEKMGGLEHEILPIVKRGAL